MTDKKITTKRSRHLSLVVVDNKNTKKPKQKRQKTLTNNFHKWIKTHDPYYDSKQDVCDIPKHLKIRYKHSADHWKRDKTIIERCTITVTPITNSKGQSMKPVRVSFLRHKQPEDSEWMYSGNEACIRKVHVSMVRADQQRVKGQLPSHRNVTKFLACLTRISDKNMTDKCFHDASS